MRYDNKTFFNETIDLDGNEFYGCTFSHCMIVFYGRESMALHDCLFVEPQWTIGDPAAMTMKFLAAMYHSVDGGRAFVEKVFERIRQNRVG